MGGDSRRLTRRGDRVLVREPVTLGLLEVRRDERAAVPAVHRGPRHPFVQAAPGGQVRVGVEGVADQRVPEIEVTSSAPGRTR